MERGNLAHRGGNGRPRISTEKINEVRVMFRDNPRLSIRAAAESLDMPRSIVQHILRKCLGLFPYKIQKLHLMIEDDKRALLSESSEWVL